METKKKNVVNKVPLIAKIISDSTFISLLHLRKIITLHIKTFTLSLKGRKRGVVANIKMWIKTIVYFNIISMNILCIIMIFTCANRLKV